MIKKLVGQGGLVSLIGTNDAIKVEQMVEKGDPEATLIYKAISYAKMPPRFEA